MLTCVKHTPRDAPAEIPKSLALCSLKQAPRVAYAAAWQPRSPGPWLTLRAFAAPEMRRCPVNGASSQHHMLSDLVGPLGFRFTFFASGWGIFTDGFAGGGAPYTHDGTTRLMLDGASGSGAPGHVTMSEQSGLSFNLYGLDAASMFPGLSGAINITGNLTGGGTVFTSISIDDTFDGYSLSGFTGLDSIDFAEPTSGAFRTTAGLALDNLLTTPKTVPEPLTLSLFGSGLAGAIAMRRRKKNAA